MVTLRTSFFKSCRNDYLIYYQTISSIFDCVIFNSKLKILGNTEDRKHN